MTHTLFDSFDGVSAKEWKQKIQFDLKGADYNETLRYQSHEGIDVKPFYNKEDLANTAHPISHPTEWQNTQLIEVIDATQGNQTAIKAISKGAESIHFLIKNEEVVPDTLLQNIEKEVYISMEFLSEDYITALNTIAQHRSHHIFVCIDIIHQLAKTGNWYQSLNQDFKTLANCIQNCTALHTTLSIDCSLYQNAGATIIQQLAYALAHANEYLNYLDTHTITPTQPTILFKTAVGSNYFFEIAKLRALRLLWNTLANEYNMLKKCYIFTTPTFRNKTILDYNVNMLRTTTECMSAILGGANVVQNNAYDSIYHHENDFGMRIALNQLLILKHESHIGAVSNPASGAYYIESLTDQFSHKALALFKNIEKGGGFLHQLKNGTIQQKIKESADKEQLLFDEEALIAIGANTYKNANEVTPEIEKNLFLEKKKRKTLINPIVYRRLCVKLEKKQCKNFFHKTYS